MSIISGDLNDMQRAVKGALNAHWRTLMFQGVVIIILGVLAICAPVAATLAVDVFIGVLFLVSGIVGLIVIFSIGDAHAFVWGLITAALSVVVGILLLWRPVAGALSLTIVLTAFFIAEGVFQTVTSIAYRELMPRSWGWLLASGIADLVLAGIIIVGWPITAAWTLGLLVGINLIMSGIAIVMMALAGRDVVKTLTDDFGGTARR
jgi:uncharacterized membrane protein HdeD (DUF308 family)